MAKKQKNLLSIIIMSGRRLILLKMQCKILKQSIIVGGLFLKRFFKIHL